VFAEIQAVQTVAGASPTARQALDLQLEPRPLPCMPYLPKVITIGDDRGPQPLESLILGSYCEGEMRAMAFSLSGVQLYLHSHGSGCTCLVMHVKAVHPYITAG
jgi:hypothetical protein